MQAMMTFTTWFLNQLPDFLLSEPIVYFIAIIILIWLLKIIFSIATYSK